MNKRLDIEGLRAIAVVAVIVHHADASWLTGGFLGVDLFFVVSGFVITAAVWRQLRERTFSFRAFMLNRVRRIVPAYLAMLAVVAVAMSLLLVPEDFTFFWESLKSAAWFNSNAWFATNYDYFAPSAAESPLLHTWSLAVEMKFYLLLPLALLILPRRLAGWALGAVVLILIGLTSYQLREGADQGVYYSLAARAPQLLIGSVLAIALADRPLSSRLNPRLLSAAGLALIVGSFVMITDETPVPGVWATPLCLGAAMVLAAESSPINTGLLSMRPLVWVGGLSYSLYLWHWPVFAGWRYATGAESLTLLPLVLALALVVSLAVMSQRFVEEPLRRRRPAGSPGRPGRPPQAGCPRQALLWGVLITGVATAASLALVLNPRVADPLRVEQTRYAAPESICHGQVVGDCVRGDRSAEQTVLLIGDSHAAQLNLFADEVGSELGVRFIVVSGSSCVPIEGFDVNRLPEGARVPCASQIAAVSELLPTVTHVMVAGKWTFQTPSQEFITAFSTFLGAQEQAGRDVMVLAQLPELDKDPRRLDRLRQLGVSLSAHVTPQTTRANDTVAKITATHPKAASFVDLSTAPLFQSLPFEPSEDRDLLYMDSHHLNERGSVAYGRTAAGELETWLHGLRADRTVPTAGPEGG